MNSKKIFYTTSKILFLLGCFILMSFFVSIFISHKNIQVITHSWGTLSVFIIVIGGVGISIYKKGYRAYNYRLNKTFSIAIMCYLVWEMKKGGSHILVNTIIFTLLFIHLISIYRLLKHKEKRHRD